MLPSTRLPYQGAWRAHHLPVEPLAGAKGGFSFVPFSHILDGLRLAGLCPYLFGGSAQRFAGCPYMASFQKRAVIPIKVNPIRTCGRKITETLKV